MKRTILVAGGAGYIGAHLVRRLRAAGQEVVVLDDLSTGHAEAVPDLPVWRRNLAEGGVAGDILGRRRFDAVFHLALRQDHANTAPTERWRETTAAVHLLAAMQTHGVRRLVCVVPGMGEADNPIVDLLGEQCATYGVATTLARLPFVVGADPGSLAGDRRIGGANWLRCALQVASGALPELFVPAGDPVQEYLHVADACDGVLRAFEQTRSSPGVSCWALGGVCAPGLAQILAAVEAQTGRQLKRGTLLAPGRDMRLAPAECLRAREALGWAPRHSTLPRLVEDGWRWERSRIYLERHREREQTERLRGGGVKA